VKVTGVRKDAPVKILRVDADHGNVLKVYDAMGRPSNPTREQIATLRTAGEAPEPEKASLRDGSLTVNIPAQGLVVLIVGKQADK
jgi:xylan 1,4-beta-xylosidase